jgi:hypothetical protein
MSPVANAMWLIHRLSGTLSFLVLLPTFFNSPTSAMTWRSFAREN